LITLPKLDKLRFLPEKQVEPDDEVTFVFDIVNEAPEFSMAIRNLEVTLWPKPGNDPPVPAVVTSLSTINPASRALEPAQGSSANDTNNDIVRQIYVRPKSSTTVYGILSTQSKLQPKAKHPYTFSMIVRITEWYASGDGTAGFVNDGLTTLAGVVSPDKSRTI